MHLQEIINYYCDKKVCVFIYVYCQSSHSFNVVHEVWILFSSAVFVPEQGNAVWDAAVWIELSGLLFVGFSWFVLFSFSETKLSQAVCFVLILIPGGSHYQASNQPVIGKAFHMSDASKNK